METLKYATLSGEETCQQFGTHSTRGLSTTEAKSRLSKHGANELPPGSRRWHTILLAQFRSPFLFLLGGAALIALLLGEMLDAGLIALFITINAGLGFWQEFRSERTLELLKAYTVSYTSLIRDGHEQAIQSTQLTPGDIILLKTGDRIPTDVRFLHTSDLSVDESVLTGESVPARKQSESHTQLPTSPQDATCLGFAGTGVVSGQAKAVVLATGAKSAIGSIAHLAAGTRHTSQFEKGIARFSSVILKLVLATLTVVIGANILVKGSEAHIGDLLIFSIALAVSVIPEALPVVTTFSLGRGALRMAKEKVVVRRLSAIEDLGGIGILCTDKTGTLTENRLTVQERSPDAAEETLLYAAVAASSPEKHSLEPFDAALWNALSPAEQRRSELSHRLDALPFDPSLRTNAVLIETQGVHSYILRGAPESVVERCANLSVGERKAIAVWVAEQGHKGRRTMAVAHRMVATQTTEASEKDLQEFTWLGLLSFEDPIKASTPEAVRLAKKLGVTVKIITGDGREVAGAVGHRIGLLASPEEVLTGAELEALATSDQHAAVERYAVFARVTPEQKHKIIQLLQEKAEVGYLGEGINDAPALKAASVSLVVQSASDIAREAADIVLLEKDLKAIVNGIREGRIVFTNTVKYIRATLASNFGNFYAVAIASLFIDFLPMLPIQLLLLNLLSDFPMIAIAADSVDDTDVAQPVRYDVRAIVFMATVLGLVSTVFDFLFFAVFYRMSPEVLQTNWFIGSILTELAFLFSIRSKRFLLHAKRPPLGIILLSAFAAMGAILIPLSNWGKEFFHFSHPSPAHLLVVFGIVAAYIVSTEITKLVFVRSMHTRQQKNTGKRKGVGSARYA